MRAILLIDGLVDLALGVSLAAAPLGAIRLLGLPPTVQPFYPSILGAVLIGVGIALLVQRRGEQAGGLGLAGAAIVNLCGALALAAWLALGALEIAAWTRTLLWILAIAIAVLAAAELALHGWRRRSG